MKCKLLDICVFRKGKVDVSKLTLKTYISTENMLPNKGGVTEASSLPTVQLTQDGSRTENPDEKNRRGYIRQDAGV